MHTVTNITSQGQRKRKRERARERGREREKRERVKERIIKNYKSFLSAVLFIKQNIWVALLALSTHTHTHTHACTHARTHTLTHSRTHTPTLSSTLQHCYAYTKHSSTAFDIITNTHRHTHTHTHTSHTHMSKHMQANTCTHLEVPTAGSDKENNPLQNVNHYFTASHAN